MEYHYGVCVKESTWGKDCCNSIVILAGDGNRFAFFVKIFNVNEEVDNDVKNIKFGSAVFFTSEKECIVDLYNADRRVDQLFTSFGNFDLREFGVFVFSQDKKCGYRFRKIAVINKVEEELINALRKKLLFDSFSNSIKELTAENILNIINEEKNEVDKYDIEDLVNNLNISYYADGFCEKTDSPEGYRLNEIRSFKNTKYEDLKFDEYLTQILKPGGWRIGEYDGWFYAREKAKENVDNHTHNIPFIKKEMKRRYSKSEHLDFRVRSKLSIYISPIFSMYCIPGRVLELKRSPFGRVFSRFDFTLDKTKEGIIAKIRQYNSYFTDFSSNEFKKEIYKEIDFFQLHKEWCIPFSSYIKLEKKIQIYN